MTYVCTKACVIALECDNFVTSKEKMQAQRLTQRANFIFKI